MILAVTGTGTGVGKTHVACALLIALRARGVRAIGWKPVESGVERGEGEDEARLREASGGQRAAPTLRLKAPLSAHLAARREGVVIDAAAVRATLDDLAARWPVVVLELAGGLFSPFDDDRDNAEWLADVAPRVALVAPDRLGVLHDLGAAVRAARAVGLGIDAIAMSAPAVADLSTGTNATELAARRRPDPSARPIAIATIPRGPIAALAEDPGIAALAARLLER